MIEIYFNIIKIILNERRNQAPFRSLNNVDPLKHCSIRSVDGFWLIDIQPKMVNVRHEGITLDEYFSDEWRLKKLADDWIFHHTGSYWYEVLNKLLLSHGMHNWIKVSVWVIGRVWCHVEHVSEVLKMSNVVLIKLHRFILIKNCLVIMVLLRGLVCWVRNVRLTGFVRWICLVCCVGSRIIWRNYETCVVCCSFVACVSWSGCDSIVRNDWYRRCLRNFQKTHWKYQRSKTV